MAPDGGAAFRNGGKNGGSSRQQQTLKKGPWTAAEDAILMEYVKKHGEGNWNSVQRNSGLIRCGKSCRLRWANHLRPNLKKGAFSAEEEALIVELHSKLGNKWARMASHLPGRTDNEIKNYWNTRLKRRQRAGLPIYPYDVMPQGQEIMTQTNPLPSSLGSLLPPSPNARRSGFVNGAPLSVFDRFGAPNSSAVAANPQQQQWPNSYNYQPNSSQQFGFFQDNNGSVAVQIASSNTPFPTSASSSLGFHNQGLTNSSLPISAINYGNLNNFGTDSTPVSGVSFEQNGVVSVTGGPELPSMESLVPATTTPSTSGNDASDYAIGSSNEGNEYGTNQGFMRGNSGLLGDLLDESQALARAEKPKEIVEEEKNQENYLWDYKLMEDAVVGQDNLIMERQNEDSISNPSQSSVCPKTANPSSQEANPADDDLLCLLNNFPLTVPVPDWYDNNCNASNGESSISTDAEAGKENQQESSNAQVATTNSETPDHDYLIGNCCWKNLPGFLPDVTD